MIRRKITPQFHLTCNTLLHYLLKFEKKQQRYRIFTLNVTINMFNKKLM